MNRSSAYSHPILYVSTLVLAAVAALLQPGVAAAAERVYLSRPEVEVSLVGKGILSKNLQSGKLSHWEFRRDGTVEAVSRSGLGRASGTWTIQDDGRMCVTMMSRTGCRYWFRQADSFANADSMDPAAPTVAEVRFE
ncbi:MAG: hypothetical protein EOP82_28585 [Variovorax sp.]|nr:MAG: hypothetical protein EOP82_28585 [Variovorax sp.]